jgi:hypothetical protein
MNKRDITLSFFKGFGFGASKNTITVKGEYKFITRNYVIAFALITDTKCYYL